MSDVPQMDAPQGHRRLLRGGAWLCIAVCTIIVFASSWTLGFASSDLLQTSMRTSFNGIRSVKLQLPALPQMLGQETAELSRPVNYRAELASYATVDTIRDLSCVGHNITDRESCLTKQQTALQVVLAKAANRPKHLHAAVSTTPSYGSWRFAAQLHVNHTMERWILMRSTSKPNAAVKQWAHIPDWQLLVVGEQGDDEAAWRNVSATIIYLSPAQQRALPYTTLQRLQQQHASIARLAAYLFAIQHGAQTIYEIDDTIELQSGANASLPWTAHTADDAAQLHACGGRQMRIVSPVSHFFGCSTRSRGYPLQELLQHGADHCMQLPYCANDSSASLPQPYPIIQGVAAGAADVDAAALLSATVHASNISNNASLSLAANTYAPYSSVNVVHRHDAFFLLFMPTTVAAAAADVYRSYFAQRLLQCMHAGVAFAATPQLRRSVAQQSTDELLDIFAEELQMYVQTASLVDFLSQWRCDFEAMYDCALQLAADMAARGFWGSDDVELLSAWLSDLTSLGVTTPSNQDAGDVVAARGTAAAADKAQMVQDIAADVQRHNPWRRQPYIGERATKWRRSKLHCHWYESQMNGHNALMLRDYNKPLSFPDRGKLYLSIVLATMNKDLTGQHFRLSFWLKTIADNTKKYNLYDMVEVIIVQWNPVPDLPDILDAPSIRWPNAVDLPLVRVVTVDHRRHVMAQNKMRAADDQSFWEFFAKNVGVRRACGEWIMGTNPDAWLSPQFWELVSLRGLNTSYSYRAPRRGTVPPPSPECFDWSQEKMFDYVVNDGGEHADGCYEWWDDWSAGLNTQEWAAVPFDPKAEKVVGNRTVAGCPGDFTLIHRDVWHYSRGYPEVPMASYLDDYILEEALAMGKLTAELPPPLLLFHLDHNRSYEGGKERPGAAFEWWWEKPITYLVSKTYEEIRKGKYVTLTNGEDWGLGYEDLPEYYL